MMKKTKGVFFCKNIQISGVKHFFRRYRQQSKSSKLERTDRGRPITNSSQVGQLRGSNTMCGCCTFSELYKAADANNFWH
jgi:hypothetical protein